MMVVPVTLSGAFFRLTSHKALCYNALVGEGITPNRNRHQRVTLGEEKMSEDQKSALEVEREKFEAEAKAENAKRTGVGLRVMVGATRGRQTQNIKYESFDVSKPDTLPTSLGQFAEVTGITDENQLLEFVIDGFNDYQYRQASDPIAEFINPVWPDDVKLAFRTSVRNYAKAAEVSIEEAANLMKPAIDKKFAVSA